MEKLYRATLLGVTLLALSCIPQEQALRSLTFVGVSIVDTVTGTVRPDSSVTIEGGVITQITVDGTVPPNTERVDARGKYLMAGLWDMHAHHQLSGQESLPLYVAAGVTGTRDMGADLEFINRPA